MGTKQSGTVGGPAIPAPSDPAKIRNVVLVGPSAAGKTTIAEAMLAATSTIPRSGKVTEGTTVCDHEPASIEQQRSIGLAIAPMNHGDVKINLIDTPGYADFVGELRAGLRAADAALFVVSATEGVDAATRAIWQECAAVGMPRAVLIARLDQPRADFDTALLSCQDAFGSGVLPLYLPHFDSGGEFFGLIGLLTEQIYELGGTVSADARVREQIDRPRGELIEAIIAESEDESLMDRYLNGEQIDEDTLIADLEKAVAKGGLHPVLPVCALTGVGIREVLEGIRRGFPSPLEHPLPEFTDPQGRDPHPLTPDPAGPLAAEVVHTSVDSYVGRVSLARVFSGTMRPERPVHVSGHGMAERGHPDHDEDERIAHLYSPLGVNLREVSHCIAGDLCALTKIGSAETGDTLSDPSDPLLLKPWPMPEPLLPIAVTAHTRSDEDALARNLNRLIAADPSLRLERDSETHQLVLWCMGEAHAEVVLQRLREGGAEVDTVPVRVPLRQTFAQPAKGHGRHVKQSGGHGQYAVCDVEVEPLPRGSGVEFTERVVGGAVPRQFIPSVEKGVRAQIEKGINEGAPLVDVRVTLVDGKAHSVDSSDAAFQAAGALALKAAAEQAGLVTLEPVDEVAVRIPDEHLGAVLGDLSSRRGKVVGTEPEDSGWTVVRAHVPASELVRYAVNVRSLSSGSATFTRQFENYEPMPESLIPQK
ncbi:translation elongation factor 2 (EF-2/EF-G) [Saccharopolyspora shandongensis]|uniref:Translation elongation factor 2 (EF-2/EF-G) n=1 Tax=Saccharopolyspora shandongensis TaxID=418495 RepID=A0A1H3RWP7_9PSEU|nr:elongation factor G-like protein EF-G2 [Saccharopolyspora shandongensis]SDZ30057.1 translation elongation factor 2 (EF-2/EF-G) [Saccharopolyspora shandongensis]